MIDLETLSTHCNAAIVSIGAVKFDKNGISDRFKINVDAKSCKEHGLHIDKETIAWWSTQSPEARHLWMTDPVSLPEAIEAFDAWYGAKSLWTFGYGANFDIVLMESAYAAVGKKEPWKYFDIMCMRTICNLLNSKPDRSQGVAHDALVDAENQAIHLIKLLGEA